MEKASSKFAFYWFLVFILFSWVLIILGGVVHNTGSSLACPDWPTCHGTFFPKMEGEVAIEHGHRLLGALVGLYALVSCFLFWKNKDSALKWGTVVALGLVIFQGILGGLTVKFELPPWISTAHLGTAMAFLGFLVFLMWRTRLSYLPNKHFFRFSLFWTLTLLAFYGQMVLGAYMRHKGGGLACTDVPFCQGGFWIFDQGLLMHLHLAHRWFAMVVFLFLFILCVRVWKKPNPFSQKFIAFLLLLLGATQIVLGFLSVYTALEIIPITTHLALGALLWMLLLWLYFSHSVRGS